VEILDFSDQNRPCPTLPAYPFAVQHLTAAFYNGQVIACGGEILSSATSKCHLLGPDLREWKEMDTRLPGGRRTGLASSVVDDKLLISGGVYTSDLKTTSLVYDGTQFSQGPELLYGKVYHCQLTINSSFVFFASGGSETFFLDWETQQFLSFDDIPISIGEVACGLLKDGLEVLVAAGEYSFIYSFLDLEWRDGPKLPNAVLNPATVQIRNGILSIGGGNAETSTRVIYRFDENLFAWTRETVTLRTDRYNAAAVAVPDDFVNC